ncbi:MAG: ATP-binding protein, partial [Bacteroidales bacterium]|nr:ATP-binding protein [Bacteroidales bacterium]
KVRGLTYRLVDFYTLFYFKYVKDNHSKDERWWTNNMLSPSVASWQGFSFELLCLLHLDQIKEALGISGIATAVSQWNGEHSQIDLIIDRADRIVNLCEMKFSTTPYEITKAYAQRLRERAADFCSATKCRKGISNTFVTTYGVKQGMHSSVVTSQVTLDDLFC